MACTTLLWGPPLPSYNSNNKFRNNSKSYCSILLNLGCYNCYSKNKSVTEYWTRQKQKKKLESVCCSGDVAQRWFSDDDDGDDDMEQGPPQEAVLKAISEVSRTEGRVGQTTNVVIGGTVTDDSTNEWISLDQKVNSYPTVRDFTAIGTGGDDFVEAMVVAVESVTHQPVPEGRVKHKLSSTGKYISVSIGPVHVVSSEQVQAVYNAMRRDDRMKYFL